MKQAGVRMLRDEEWREVDGVMYKEGKVYVLKDDKLRAEIIRLHHNTPVGEHGEQQKTVELVTQNFWWPGVTKEVKQYVEGYDAYQRNKNHICKKAKLQAGIKPTALCSAIDKENLIEFLLDSVHYLYMKSNPNSSFYPMLSYESLSSRASIDKKK